jgi:isoquinoline 1-oxidoreductase
MTSRRDAGDLDHAELAPERYELAARTARLPLDRRAFFRLLGGGGFAAAATLTTAADAQDTGGGGRGRGGELPQQLGAWLHIAEDGAVTVFTGKVEIGQDIRTSLTQAVLDELPVPIDRLRLVMGDTALTPFDAGTFGSRTTPAMAPQLRRVAATARTWLLARAAERWKADAATLTIADGKVADAAGRRTLGFGALTRGKKILELVPGDTPLRPPAEWSAGGRSLAKVDARAVVTGQRQYTSDLRRPGMLIGKVLRPPRLGAALDGLDDAAARAMPGVTVVHEGGFAGVAARDAFTAGAALAALAARWNEPAAGDARVDSAGLYAALRGAGRQPPGDQRDRDRDKGDVDQALRTGAHRLTTSHEIAYIAHAPLEPRAAVAEWSASRARAERGNPTASMTDSTSRAKPDQVQLTVWTGTQRPFGVRRELAQAFALPEAAVRVIAADTGSGYGGKHSGEAAVEAARLARAARRPVKLVWTREEEFSWAYFRPAGVIDIRSAVAADGKLLAWEARNINSGGSGLRTPYEVPNQRHRFLPAEAPLRQGSYRGLAATANHFAREIHMDELAALVRQDPLAFRERNLTDERLRAVLRAAAERFGWGRRKPAAGSGVGLACGAEKGGYVACCVELAAAPDGDPADVTIARVVTAFECGAVVNPDHLTSQIEGSVIMGLGGALFEAVEFVAGRVRTTGFADYRVPRHGDVPPLETVLVDRPDRPSAGAGETPIGAIAPAVANALAAVTGKRYPNLPLART